MHLPALIQWALYICQSQPLQIHVKLQPRVGRVGLCGAGREGWMACDPRVGEKARDSDPADAGS